MLVDAICGDTAGGRGVVLDGVSLRGIAVVCWGEHHGGLVRLGILVVEVDHTSTAIRSDRHTAQEGEAEMGEWRQSRRKMEWQERREEDGEIVRPTALIIECLISSHVWAAKPPSAITDRSRFKHSLKLLFLGIILNEMTEVVYIVQFKNSVYLTRSSWLGASLWEV